MSSEGVSLGFFVRLNVICLNIYVAFIVFELSSWRFVSLNAVFHSRWLRFHVQRVLRLSYCHFNLNFPNLRPIPFSPKITQNLHFLASPTSQHPKIHSPPSNPLTHRVRQLKLQDLHIKAVTNKHLFRNRDEKCMGIGEKGILDFFIAQAPPFVADFCCLWGRSLEVGDFGD